VSSSPRVRLASTSRTCHRRRRSCARSSLSWTNQAGHLGPGRDLRAAAARGGQGDSLPLEKWGTGLPRAIQSLTEAGLPAPEFKELPISLRVIVHIKDHDVTPRASSPDDVVRDVVRDVTVGMADSERSILAILRSQGSVPARELASQTGLSDRQVQRVLVRLADRGFIKREGSTRYGKWVVTD